MAEGRPSRGPLGTLQDLAASLLGSAHTRLALLGNELQIEKHLALRQFVLALALLFCAGLSVLMMVAVMLVLWWDQRLLLLGLLCGLFVLLTVWLGLRLRASTARPDPVFGASLAELQQDLQALKAAAGHGQKPD